MCPSEPPRSVEEMISAARANPGKLGELLERYRSFLTLKARQQLPQRVTTRVSASDVVQHTVTEALKSFAQFVGQTEAEFSAWIKRIHQHNLQDVLRKHLYAEGYAVGKERPFDDGEATASFCWREPAAKQSTPSQRVIRAENALRLAQIIESLPPSQGEAIRLRHLEGWPVDRIAEHLGRTTAATAGLLKRGLDALRRKMSEESWMQDRS